MDVEPTIASPRTSLRTLYRRCAWNVRSAIAPHPRLFGPIMRLKARERGWMVQEDTQLVIEGFPRSANTFAVVAFRMSQNAGVKISHHTHAPANVIAGVQRSVPTLVLIRHPVEAVTSWVLKYPYKSVSQIIKYYARFYTTIAPYRDGFVLARFEQVTSDFGSVIQLVNTRFGTKFAEFEHTEDHVQQCFARMDSYQLKIIDGAETREGHLHYPTARRHKLKAAAREELLSDRYAPLLARAEEVYAEMLNEL